MRWCGTWLEFIKFIQISCAKCQPWRTKRESRMVLNIYKRRNLIQLSKTLTPKQLTCNVRDKNSLFYIPNEIIWGYFWHMSRHVKIFQSPSPTWLARIFTDLINSAHMPHQTISHYINHIFYICMQLTISGGLCMF